MAIKPVRWGVLGVSHVAERFVADLKTVPGVEVCGVGSRDVERAKSFAAKFDIPEPYGSYTELAEAPDIDVIYVSSVHPSHYPDASLCLKNGKGVLCEKPFTVNLPDAERLVSLARSEGLFLMEAMWTRCNPLMNEMRDLIRKGELGEIVQVQANLGPSAGRNPRVQDRMRGGGILLECGVYPLNFAFHFLGSPQSVQANAHFTPAGVDDATAMLLQYESGASAALTTSIVYDINTGHWSNGTILGTKGWIYVPTDSFFPAEYILHRPGAGNTTPEHVVKPRVGNGYVEEATEVTRCIRAGLLESPMVPLDDTLATMTIIQEVLDQIGLSYPTVKV